MVTMTRTALGDRILSLRNQREWTQGQLALKAGVKRSWLSLVESGERERPNGEMLAMVARALGVTSDYLLTGRSEGDDPEKEQVLGQLKQYPTPVLKRVLRMIGVFVSEEPPPHEQTTDESNDSDDNHPPATPK